LSDEYAECLAMPSDQVVVIRSSNAEQENLLFNF
jgi:hypothetical protein